MQNKIEQWVGHNFESSSGLTPEFQSFCKDIKSFLKKELAKDFDFSISRGHFYFSGFAQNRITKKFAYFSCSDVRYFPNEWFNNLLVRIAKNDKDYTGGSNNSAKILDIKQVLIGLTR